MRQNAGFSSHAEEAAHAFDAFFIEVVVDVGGKVGADGGFWNGEFAGPFGSKSFNVLNAVDAGLVQVLRDTVIQNAALRSSPDGGDKREPGESAPFVGQIVVNEFFAGALEAVGTLFEGEQGRIADDDCGIGLVEHGVEIGGHG